MAKYDPLETHLRRQKGDIVEMSFDDIERRLGALLPHSAERPEWWSNERTRDSRHVQCRAWLAAGYAATLLRGRERVRFTRTAARAAHPDGRTLAT
jgi:hypothetical protein